MLPPCGFIIFAPRYAQRHLFGQSTCPPGLHTPRPAAVPGPPAGAGKRNILTRAVAMRLKLTIAYVGTHFKGWQVQAHAHYPNPRTVQAELEAAIGGIAGRPVVVLGSGRTDSGVHADGQVAHVDIPEDKAGINWLRAINSKLPPDVAILAVEPVPDDFHAQNSCRRKAYTYSLWLSQAFTPPRLREFVWRTGPLNLTAMEEAAACLLGEHDFAAMQNVGTPKESTVRTIYSLTRHPDANPTWDGTLVHWRVEGNGFLKQMVRNIMGLLVEVGRGKLAPAEVPGIIETRDRKAAPATAPAQGLTLSAVYYS